MKKFLVILVAMTLCSSAAFAQNKGDKYIGGYTGVAIQSVGIEGENATAAGFAIEPEFGYFVANRLKIGASVGYSISSGTHTFTLCPTIAYYIPLCDGLYYTPGLEVGLVIGSSEGFTMPGVGLAAHLFTLEFRPTEHFGFSANLVSLDMAVLTKSGITASAVDFNLCVNPTVGFKYYF